MGVWSVVIIRVRIEIVWVIGIVVCSTAINVVVAAAVVAAAIVVRIEMMRMQRARIAPRIDGHFAIDIVEGNGGDGSRSEGGTGIGEIGEGAGLGAYGASGVGEGEVGGLVVVVWIYGWDAVAQV